MSPLFQTTPIFDEIGSEPGYCQQIATPDLLLVEARTPRQHYLRDAKWGRQNDDADHFIFNVYFSGQNLVICGETEFVMRGAVSLVNLHYESEGFSAPAHLLSLVLPRDLIHQHLPHLGNRRGDLFPDGGLTERLLFSHLMTMRREMDGASLSDSPALTNGFLGLVDALTRKPDDFDAKALRPVLYETITAYIAETLSHPDLDVDHLLRRFHISRSTLFRLFQDHGGVAAYIQRQRLTACYRKLMSRSTLARPIYDIAAEVGLTNASHLSTQFRQRFGQTPREVRLAARHAQQHMPSEARNMAPEDPAERMRARVHHLGQRHDGGKTGPYPQIGTSVKEF